MTTAVLDKNSNKTLRVAFPSFNRGLDYEPTDIRLAYEYIFLENIYSPLVEISAKDGDLKEGVASKMTWKGDELHLEIRDNLKTASGKPITAKDVVFSLKRLLILASNTHGNFGDLVCPGVHLTSITQDCPGIELRGNTVILKAEKRKSFLLPMLGAIDFAVIPQESVDPKTLKIINYAETSGPYYVSNFLPDGTIELKANLYHYQYTSKMPQDVTLLPFDRSIPNGGLKFYADGKADHIMTTNSSQVEDIIEFANNNQDTTNLHVTMNIRNILLVFTEKGVKELSQKERQNIALGVKKSFEDIYSSKKGFEVSHEFFSAMADGGLTKDQQESLNTKYGQSFNTVDKPIKVALLKSGDISTWENAVNSVAPKASCFKDVRVPDLSEYKTRDEMPHAFIAGTDSSYFEDINLISYSLNAGYFGLSKPERKEWLAHYMSLDSKSERLLLLRQLHYNVLNDFVLVPLVISPFVALSSKEWKMELSQLYANNQIWLLRHQ